MIDVNAPDFWTKLIEVLLEGTWDAMGMLLDGADEVAGTAERLPYINGFAS